MAEKDAVELEAGGRPRGLLFLVAGIVAGVLIGGAAVFFFLSGGDESASVQDEAAIEEQAQAAKEKAEKKIDLLVVPVRRFALPLIDNDNRILGYMWVDLAFEVDGPDNQSYVAARLPELRDGFLRDLNSRQTTQTDRPGALDFDLVHDRLLEMTHQVMGKGHVLNVRITNAQRVPE
ncbi:hypothetical protein GCM10007972_25070 [Iodidimonas muriae]|uniref:Flagellar protein FliL n=1 Tax=Iodidimonas muriae TaxID=261467 RepID=A0ABQ2LG00_9PROT|nr:hypothetical protein [Iodidimonas muriae]GER08332.1 hypothetical protein JCM17843_26420 [Kordiimonadales bacterium JCM 17843]GGO16264.1 hypothetical protein GCM10007972_25070 [Iodidimonas muriae]